MLYTVLPGITLCMTLLSGNNTDIPMVNIAVDSDRVETNFRYTNYLDAAMILLQVAKQMKAKESNVTKEGDKCESKSDDELEASQTEADDKIDSSPDVADQTLRCPKYPMDCEELLLFCGFQISGVYRIWPRSRINSWGDAGFDVFCDMETDGGGWTVFQRRDDFGTGSDFFFKNWLNYKYGFGLLNYDFWLGNDKVFALSNQRRSMLRFDLVDFADEVGYATYDNFYLDDEREGYRLHIGDFRGNISDSFSGHNLCRFSTRDRDNDRNAAAHCAQVYKGGWWYNECHTANLNGLYLRGTHNSYANGVNWYGWRGFRYSLKKTEMKLRSSNFIRLSKSVDTN